MSDIQTKVASVPLVAPPRIESDHDPLGGYPSPMAENSLHILPYRRSPQLSLSDSDKADLITTKLEQHAIALTVLSKYPDAMNDYRIAVGAKKVSLSAKQNTPPEVLRRQNGIQTAGL